MQDYLFLLLGVISAGIGGELFVRGTVGLASMARIRPGIVGATVAAFATSSPELSVAISSALAGKPSITLGDALGSNVVNVALILALALIISSIQCSRDSIKRDFPVALLIPVVTGVLLLDGELSRIDGMMMMAIFIAWLVATIIEARKQRNATAAVLGAHRVWAIILSSLAGLGCLIFAGIMIVSGAKGIAESLGIHAFVIGATIVAIGTSVPELATAVIAKFRGHDEVGLGTILGSNIYNGVFIISVAAIIHPIQIHWREVAIALVFGFLALIFTYPSKTGLIERRRGVLLLMLYVAYLVAILQQNNS